MLLCSATKHENKERAGKPAPTESRRGELVHPNY